MASLRKHFDVSKSVAICERCCSYLRLSHPVYMLLHALRLSVRTVNCASSIGA